MLDAALRVAFLQIQNTASYLSARAFKAIATPERNLQRNQTVRVQKCAAIQPIICPDLTERPCRKESRTKVDQRQNQEEFRNSNIQCEQKRAGDSGYHHEQCI